jgi:transposase
VYVRFARWQKYGVWQRMAEALQSDADLEELFIDATIGRSRGGLSTKAHACVDALGNPIRLLLTAGQVADVTQGAALVAAISDKGCDSDALLNAIEATGAQAIIPPRSNRSTQRKIDWHRYQARNLVERFFNRLKQFRRIATRYDKLACRFVRLACAYIWLLWTRPSSRANTLIRGFLDISVSWQKSRVALIFTGLQ